MSRAWRRALPPGGVLREQLEEPIGVQRRPRTEVRKAPPRARQRLAVRLDPVDGLALVERRVRETALVDDDDLAARLATAAEDALERPEGAEVSELGRQLFTDLADHRILAALAQLAGSACSS